MKPATSYCFYFELYIFQLTIDRAHTSAIVSASGFGPWTAPVRDTARDLEIWNISTKSKWYTNKIIRGKHCDNHVCICYLANVHY